MAAGATKLCDGVPPFLQLSPVGRWGWHGVAIVEASAGLAWLIGRPSTPSIRMASFTMLFLAALGFGMVLHGVTECPCFSSRSPIALTAMVGLDVAFAGALALVSASRSSELRCAALGAGILRVAVVIGIGTGLVAVLVHTNVMLVDRGTEDGTQDVTVLDFGDHDALARIARAMDGDIDWEHGCLVILLMRHDCSDCREVLQDWQTSIGALREAGVKVVLVDLSREGAKVALPDASTASLRDEQRWFVPTPQALVVRDGVRVAALTGTDVRPKNVTLSYLGAK